MEAEDGCQRGHGCPVWRPRHCSFCSSFGPHLRGPRSLLWAALAGSDFVDGWLARRQGPSASGAFLDPLADKFLVLGALAAMAALGQVTWVPVALLAIREVVITSYRRRGGPAGGQRARSAGGESQDTG